MDYSRDPSEYYHQHYMAKDDRYDKGRYRKNAGTGLSVSDITIGTWQNFGHLESRESVRDLYCTAFDNGIISFDFGNNYGRPPGSSEKVFGDFITNELKPYRDELVIATKAGYEMWPGPNGTGSSAKYLISSLDASLKRMNLDYVDIFYSHRYDPETPLEEVADALDMIRRTGKAIYIGVSSYPHEEFVKICELCAIKGTKIIANQSNYSIYNTFLEKDIISYCNTNKIGIYAFSPLAQGLLSNNFLTDDNTSRRKNLKGSSFWVNDIESASKSVEALSSLAQNRGQTLSQMAISWILRSTDISSVVLGIRTSQQLLENLSNINSDFSDEELTLIKKASQAIDVNLW